MLKHHPMSGRHNARERGGADDDSDEYGDEGRRTVQERSLVSDIDQVAELRATALAELAGRTSLDSTIAADDDEDVQVLDARGRVVAASGNVRGRPLLVRLRPQESEPAKATIDAVVGVPGKFRVLALPHRRPLGR